MERLVLRKIEKWMSRKGYILEPNNESYVDLHTHTVCINTQTAFRIRNIEALHECGHIILANKSDYSKRFASSNRTDSRSTEYKIYELQEEFEAWDEAWKLKNKMGVKSISWAEFNKVKVSCLKSYVDGMHR
jgi:predicted metal-dependent hydrolase